MLGEPAERLHLDLAHAFTRDPHPPADLFERLWILVVLRGVRRYSLIASVVAIVGVPPLLIWIPNLIRLVNGPKYVGASTAARLLILAAAVQLVVGWSKSFPVTIGRPGLRILTHGIETIVVLPLTVVFGLLWGAAGAAGAVLGGMCAFAVVWAVVFLRIEPEDIGPPTPVIDIGPALP